MRKIIIDADPGTDDTFAILLATASPEFDIQGICTVAGNCSLENATQNAFKILDLANKNNIPVYAGKDKPLKCEGINAEYVHGSNGMGGIEYLPINRVAEKVNAVDFIINTVNNNPGEITIVALGPLTNIATAINKNIEFTKNIKELIIMGGGVNEGNVTPFAEFNFYRDPDAAKIVFESNLNKVTMLGLNVTHKLPLNPTLESRLNNSNNPLANFLYNITRAGAEFDKKEGHGGLILHDPITFAYLLDNSIVTVKPAKVTIENEGEKKGMSNVTVLDESNCYVGFEVNCDKFYKLLFKRIFNWDIKKTS